MGRDDRLLLAYLKRSAVSSDIDIPTWRNRASLRVRQVPATIEGERGDWNSWAQSCAGTEKGLGGQVFFRIRAHSFVPWRGPRNFPQSLRAGSTRGSPSKQSPHSGCTR